MQRRQQRNQKTNDMRTAIIVTIGFVIGFMVTLTLIVNLSPDKQYEEKILYERKPIEYIDGIQTYYYVPYDTILIEIK